MKNPERILATGRSADYGQSLLKKKGAYWFRLTVGVTGRMPRMSGRRVNSPGKNTNANSNVVDATESFETEYALAA